MSYLKIQIVWPDLRALNEVEIESYAFTFLPRTPAITTELCFENPKLLLVPSVYKELNNQYFYTVFFLPFVPLLSHLLRLPLPAVFGSLASSYSSCKTHFWYLHP